MPEQFEFSEEEKMLVSKIKEEDLTFEMVDRLLFQGLEDTGENVDCIIVLGSVKAAQYRVPVAVDAYNAGRASKLMLCGGALRDFPVGRCSEAEHMYKAALELGVAEENVILENSSQNTVENILFALIELQRAFWLNKVRRVLLVTTAYHMRRSLAIARYLFPEHIAIVPCPANDNNTKRDNWMNTPVGIERAKGEAMNIVRSVINGVIPDFEI
ncbi:MAG: YdcF family protein [Clostridia bacterium]|nr:YdcF family protein [Clostridia bacterium]